MTVPLALDTDLGTQYECEGELVVINIKAPLKGEDGSFWTAISIGSFLSNARIVGDTPLDSYWHAIQFAMSHLHMLYSDGRLSISGEMKRAIEDWHNNSGKKR